jgi:hypothetical protein
VIARTDYKIEGFQPSITSGVPEVDHLNVMVFNVFDDVGFCKFFRGFVKILYQRVRV